MIGLPPTLKAGLSRRHFAGGLCSCAFGLTLAGCTTTSSGTPGPVLPPMTTDTDAAGVMRPGYRPPPGSDEASLWQVMDKAEQEVRRSNLLIRDRALNDYIRVLVNRLAGPYSQDLRIYIVRNPNFNASMAPNGMMQVWTGMLLRVRNEAQLAAVIGHELGHYVRRHSIEHWRDLRTKADIGVFLTLGLGFAGAMMNMALMASVMSYSRDNEREADAFGLEKLAQNGYAPVEAARVWEQLIAEEAAATDKRDRGFFFATHPSSDERAETLRQMATARAGTETSAERFHRSIADIRPTLFGDQIKLRDYGRSESVINTLIADGYALGETKFYKGEIYRLRDGEGDSDKALDSYRQAIAAGGAPPEVHRSIGLVLWRRNERKDAVEAYREYLRQVPNASDRRIIESYIQFAG